jgi:hypothetical protein
MRKLLLLTNCLSLCALLSSCQTTTSNSTENKTDTTQTVVAIDSIAKSKVVSQADTLMKNTSTHSETKTTNANSSNSSKQQTTQTKTKEIKRIEHGSNDQAKLDSIKNAKAKIKK